MMARLLVRHHGAGRRVAGQRTRPLLRSWWIEGRYRQAVWRPSRRATTTASSLAAGINAVLIAFVGLLGPGQLRGLAGMGTAVWPAAGHAAIPARLLCFFPWSGDRVPFKTTRYDLGTAGPALWPTEGAAFVSRGGSLQAGEWSDPRSGDPSPMQLCGFAHLPSNWGIFVGWIVCGWLPSRREWWEPSPGACCWLPRWPALLTGAMAGLCWVAIHRNFPWPRERPWHTKNLINRQFKLIG